MVSSMTGFGHVEYQEGSKRVVCEIKSVNHRYLDVTVKTSRRVSSLEPLIRETLKKNIGRGKVDIYVHYEESAEETYSVRYNEKLARSYVENLAHMAETFSLKNDMTASVLASYPDVFELVMEERDDSGLSDWILLAVQGALDAFLKSRQVEGDNLKADLLDKMNEMEGYVRIIEDKAPSIIEEYKARLMGKIADLLDDKQIDESRIAAEVTIFADKICVDEELVRLKSHIKEMTLALNRGGAIGRHMDFLAQEMNREANTILSKSTDAEIASIGISLKTLIEKVREQIQNLE